MDLIAKLYEQYHLGDFEKFQDVLHEIEIPTENIYQWMDMLIIEFCPELPTKKSKKTDIPDISYEKALFLMEILKDPRIPEYRMLIFKSEYNMFALRNGIANHIDKSMIRSVSIKVERKNAQS